MLAAMAWVAPPPTPRPPKNDVHAHVVNHHHAGIAKRPSLALRLVPGDLEGSCLLLPCGAGPGHAPWATSPLTFSLRIAPSSRYGVVPLRPGLSPAELKRRFMTDRGVLVAPLGHGLFLGRPKIARSRLLPYYDRDLLRRGDSRPKLSDGPAAGRFGFAATYFPSERLGLHLHGSLGGAWSLGLSLVFRPSGLWF
jgi:hypothetical protein